jgi:hypothetical protein
MEAKNQLDIVTTCPDAKICMALGRYTYRILDLFDSFRDFSRVVKMEHIGSKSTNGFVTKLTFDRILENGQSYQCDTVLKSAKSYVSDNLYYEYFAGTFVNYLCTLSPFFTYTMGMYQYNDIIQDGKSKKSGGYGQLKKLSGINDSPNLSLFLNDNITFRKGPYLSNKVSGDDLTDACDMTRANGLAIMTEYIPNAQSLGTLLGNSMFNQFDLFPTCLILYGTLSTLAKNFTHYDLHSGNVMMISCPKNKIFRYHMMIYDENGDYSDEIVVDSRYLPKIIDYGRSYFRSEKFGKYPTVSSYDVYDEICKWDNNRGPDRYHKCCSDVGFKSLHDTPSLHKTYVHSSANNWSHDLRLVDSISEHLRHKGQNVPYWNDIEANLVYKKDYGTPRAKNRLSGDGKIRTVCDMWQFLLNDRYKKFKHECFPEFVNATVYAEYYLYLTMSPPLAYSLITTSPSATS